MPPDDFSNKIRFAIVNTIRSEVVDFVLVDDSNELSIATLPIDSQNHIGAYSSVVQTYVVIATTTRRTLFAASSTNNKICDAFILKCASPQECRSTTYALVEWGFFKAAASGVL